MEPTFHLEITTPEKMVFSGEVLDFVGPGIEGSFEILKHHAAFISVLKIGEMRVRAEDGYDTYYATSGGIAEIRGNKMIVLAETCEKATDIDIQRAMEIKEWARKKLEERSSIDLEQVRKALARAINRIQVAEKRVNE